MNVRTSNKGHHALVWSSFSSLNLFSSFVFFFFITGGGAAACGGAAGWAAGAMGGAEPSKSGSGTTDSGALMVGGMVYACRAFGVLLVRVRPASPRGGSFHPRNPSRSA